MKIHQPPWHRSHGRMKITKMANGEKDIYVCVCLPDRDIFNAAIDRRIPESKIPMIYDSFCSYFVVVFWYGYDECV